MSTAEHKLVVTSSPQYHDAASTANVMWAVSACLAPAAAWGVYVFGFTAARVLAAATLSALAVEFLIGLAFNRRSLSDGSAFLTGLLVGMNMPPAVPLYIPVVASTFAIAVVKWSFGGLGSNWMNPALAGRVFVFFSWTGHMTNWSMPRTLTGLDGVTGATMLSAVKSGIVESPVPILNPVRYLDSIGFPRSVTDVNVTSWLNTNVLNPFGAHLPGGYIDPFVGNIPGSIGEVSALLLLLGSVYLIARRIITWEIPTSYFGTFAVLVWVFGGTPYGSGYFAGDILFHVTTGGFVLAVFFMATDIVTSPITARGMIVYGVGAGLLTFLIRFFGSFPEGASLAIIVMNVFVPLINRYTGPHRFGVVRANNE